MNHNRLPRLVCATLACCAMVTSFATHAANWYPLPAESVTPPLDPNGARADIQYVPLTRATRPWNICVSFPHMKDAYWLGVDYGVIQEAKDLGVKVHVFEAGGYTNLGTQISQLEDCVASGADAVVIGAISADGLNNLAKTLSARKIPVIDLVNGMTSPNVSAKSLVSFYTMGHATGEYLAARHPAGSPATKVAWFPGPAGAGWVESANKGFMDAVKGSAIQVLEPKYGDTGKEVQGKLIEETLQAHPDVSYVVGTAVTAEVAPDILKARHQQGNVKVLSFYLSPEVYKGIQNGTILASPADGMVLQGRIAIDQATRLLEGKDVVKHVGPKIEVIDARNIGAIHRDTVLAPPDFTAQFKAN
ncbi:TMAO reductase system periplasmic protein TorT [Paraburkholderia sp. J41]|uniref:TMAO reductase system periplasmic protein TorT n=1 Tax=Paraburkholderia sp. J41 TaxID=2805433 RepID=UPI002AC32AF3|nr:TMAO reductase system periplasmic protein TorT [Paraburkholderia sp. J41]